MHLLIFDIDGTLSNTTNIDDECFIDVLYNCFRISLLMQEWTKYKVETTGTDEGLVKTIYRAKFRKQITKDELELFKEYYFKALLNEFEKSPEKFSEVKGALEMINYLSRDNNFRIAIATGSWRKSAEMKLNAIGISPQSFPLSCSDGITLRYYIVKNAIEMAKDFYMVKEFEKITYIGDGIWDYVTSQHLNINFVGVDSQKKGKLQVRGVEKVINDFSKLDDFINLLQ